MPAYLVPENELSSEEEPAKDEDFFRKNTHMKLIEAKLKEQINNIQVVNFS